MKTTTARVRCSGHYHQISKTKKGQLAFHDHSRRELCLEEDLRKAAGMPPACRCAEVLRNLRKRNLYKVPKALWPPLGTKAKLPEHPPLDLRGRAEVRLIDVAQEALESCDYRRSQSSWAGGEHIISVRVSDAAKIKGYSSRAWSKNSKWTGTNSNIDVALPLRWLALYRAGHAVIDGLFVLERLGSDAALIAKQGRGFALNARVARVDFEAGKIIKWL